MPTQALIRYLPTTKIEQMIADAGMTNRLAVEQVDKDRCLVRCSADGEEIKTDELKLRAAALQKICDADAAKMPKAEPKKKITPAALAAREKMTIGPGDVATISAKDLGAGAKPPPKP